MMAGRSGFLCFLYIRDGIKVGGKQVLIFQIYRNNNYSDNFIYYLKRNNIMLNSRKRKKTSPTKIDKYQIKKSKYGPVGLIRENKGLTSTSKNFNRWFLKKFPTERDAHFFSHVYHSRFGQFGRLFQFYIELYEYLDISSSDVSHLKQLYYSLENSDANRKKEDFKRNFLFLLLKLEETDENIYSRLKDFYNIECYRISEGMNCLSSRCNLAAVVMIVSAVENRLHKVIEKKEKSLYEKEFKKATLGSIIELWRKDTRYKDPKYDRLKNILPEKHNHLIEVLNTYRIFSAHAKEEFISSQMAKAIILLSFLLLMDKSLRI